MTCHDIPMTNTPTTTRNRYDELSGIEQDAVDRLIDAVASTHLPMTVPITYATNDIHDRIRRDMNVDR